MPLGVLLGEQDEHVERRGMGAEPVRPPPGGGEGLPVVAEGEGVPGLSAVGAESGGPALRVGIGQEALEVHGPPRRFDGRLRPAQTRVAGEQVGVRHAQVRGLRAGPLGLQSLQERDDPHRRVVSSSYRPAPRRAFASWTWTKACRSGSSVAASQCRASRSTRTARAGSRSGCSRSGRRASIASRSPMSMSSSAATAPSARPPAATASHGARRSSGYRWSWRMCRQRSADAARKISARGVHDAGRPSPPGSRRRPSASGAQEDGG
ncbi:hypothetical protein DRB96_34020 [Streptomyces sp. ICC1]|nr:hypothetical protein DRB89_33270 [Streptomyces sp. ICC4]AWZ16410.1 hypothetical protein DRB96_34020 [Streptomyces sp. ICC1]